MVSAVPDSVRTPASVADFEPLWMLEVELGQPLVPIPALHPQNGRRYQRARVLVRLHPQPLGLVDIALGAGGVSADECARSIWQELGGVIAAHLYEDGLPVVAGLDVVGLPCAAPPCLRARERVRADAPFVSVVVCTRDRAESLRSCLQSLLAVDYPNYEIIVVDNAPSTPATADLVQNMSAALPHVRYVREDCPGIVLARNRGLVEARGAIVAYTDDDVVVDRYWLVELAKGFHVAENVVCVTGLILPMELDTPAQVWFEQFGGFNKGFTRRIFDMGPHRPTHPFYPYAPGTYGSGNNMVAFKTKTFRDSIGGFDFALCVAGAEDPAAYFDVITRGYRLVYEPAAIVHHLHRRDYAGLQKQMYRYGVGLTAYLTKCLVDNPRLVLDLLTKVPYGLFYMFSPRSPKNNKKAADYPRELTSLERQGALYGPLTYLRGRCRARRLRKGFGLRRVPPPTSNRARA